MNEIVYAFGKFIGLSDDQIKLCEAINNEDYATIDEIIDRTDHSIFDSVQNGSCTTIPYNIATYIVKRYCEKIIDPTERCKFRLYHIICNDNDLCEYIKSDSDVDLMLKHILHRLMHPNIIQTSVDNGYQFRMLNYDSKITISKESKIVCRSANIADIVKLYDYADYFASGKEYILHYILLYGTEYDAKLTEDDLALLIDFYRGDGSVGEQHLLFLYAMQNDVAGFEDALTLTLCDAHSCDDMIDKILCIITKDKVAYEPIYNFLIDHFTHSKKNLYLVEKILICEEYHMIDELFDIFDPGQVSSILMCYYMSNYNNSAHSIAKILLKYYEDKKFDANSLNKFNYNIKEKLSDPHCHRRMLALSVGNNSQFKKIEHYLLFLSANVEIYEELLNYLKINKSSYNKFCSLLLYNVSRRNGPMINFLMQNVDLKLIKREKLFETLVTLIYDSTYNLSRIEVIPLLAKHLASEPTPELTFESLRAILSQRYFFSANGASSASCANGAKGTTGADGAKGTTGADGAKGTTGADGAKGTTGADGANGANGASGANNAIFLFPCFRPELLNIPELHKFRVLGYSALEEINAKSLFVLNGALGSSKLVVDAALEKMSLDQINNVLIECLKTLRPSMSTNSIVARLFDTLKRRSGDDFVHYINQELFDLFLRIKYFEAIPIILAMGNANINYCELAADCNIGRIKEDILLHILQQQTVQLHDEIFCERILNSCITSEHYSVVLFLLDNYNVTIGAQQMLKFIESARWDRILDIKAIIARMRHQIETPNAVIDFAAALSLPLQPGSNDDWVESLFFLMDVMK